MRPALLIVALLAAAPAASRPPQPEAASGWTAKPEARGARDMAVTANPHATAAAREMLRAGGSAVDAAVAAQFVLNLVEPQSSGIGGGGFLLTYDAQRRRVRAYDGRESAPSRLRPERFLDEAGRPLAFARAAVGGRAVGVPGLVAMLRLAHRDHGRLPWPRLLQPAIRLAEGGFAVSARLHALLARDAHLRRDPQARALYYREDGSALPVGSRVVNRRFARVLREIAEDGGEGLYRGALARRIAGHVAAHGENPGDLAPADLAAYRAVERDPLCGAYRGWRICGMPPPSAGAVTTLQILGLIERVGLPPRPLSPLAAHRFSEAARLAHADRVGLLGDPAFSPQPVAALLAPGYLDGRARLVDDATSMGTARPGLPAGPSAPAAERPATTHLSVVDARGNAAALTSSIEDAFGSRIMVEGFLLNNQLTDFAFTPGPPGDPRPNEPAPGKRPLSSMAPTLVFDAGGRLAGVLGSPGGSRITNYVSRTLVALLDWKLTPSQALALPHYGSRNGPTELEAGTEAERLAAPLRQRGHEVAISDMTSGLHLVWRGPAGWIGAADPRREGAALGR